MMTKARHKKTLELETSVQSTKHKRKPQKKSLLMDKSKEVHTKKKSATRVKENKSSSAKSAKLKYMIAESDYKEKNGIKYAVTCDKPNLRSGFIKMASGVLKRPSICLMHMRFTVLDGNVDLIWEDKVFKYKCGSHISVNTNTKYGLHNNYPQECLIHYYSYKKN